MRTTFRITAIAVALLASTACASSNVGRAGDPSRVCVVNASGERLDVRLGNARVGSVAPRTASWLVVPERARGATLRARFASNATYFSSPVLTPDVRSWRWVVEPTAASAPVRSVTPAPRACSATSPL